MNASYRDWAAKPVIWRVGVVIVVFGLFGSGEVAAQPPLGAPHTTYAVLFSGGGDSANNHDRYYDETLRMWDIATTLFGVNQVYTLFADGTDPAIDRSSNVSSDWTPITNAGGHIQPATSANLQAVLAQLAIDIEPTDSFYLWTFDHGDGDEPGPNIPDEMPYEAKLIGWGANDEITDDQLATWVQPINAMAEAYAFGQCFCGGMADDILGAPNADNRFVAWAQGNYDCSYGQGWIDAWADGLELAIAGGDVDDTLAWSTYKLGGLAQRNDPFGFGAGAVPPDRGLERPGYAGYNFHFLSNEAVPEPGTLGLLLVGVIALVASRHRC
jgi:hypothetical protein